MFVLKQTKKRCRLKPLRRKDRKILHELLGKVGIRYIRAFVFVKTSEKVCL